MDKPTHEHPSSPLQRALADPVRRELLDRILNTDEGLGRAFDLLTETVAASLPAPVALVSLVDRDRQHFVGNTGLDGPAGSGTPLSHSFCRHVVDRGYRLRIDDSRRHPLVAENPSVVELGVAAYAGEPITIYGYVVGSACAIDHQPRVWTEQDSALLRRFADLAEHLIIERLGAELRASEPAAAPQVPQPGGASRAEVFSPPGTGQPVRGGAFAAASEADRGRLHFTIGDVSGHGPGAAALAAELRASWRALLAAGVDHAGTMQALDELTRESGLRARVLLGTTDSHGQLLLTSAGHRPPILITSSAPAELAASPGAALGLPPPAAGWRSTRHELGAGTLLAYTGGLIEGLGAGGERLGVGGLLRAVAQAGPDTKRLHGIAAEWNGGPLPDDLAILSVPPGRPAPPATERPRSSWMSDLRPSAAFPSRPAAAARAPARIALATLLPEILELVPGKDRELVTHRVSLPEIEIADEDLGGLFARAAGGLGFAIIGGVVFKATTLGDRPALELLGPDDILAPPLSRARQLEAAAISRYRARDGASRGAR